MAEAREEVLRQLTVVAEMWHPLCAEAQLDAEHRALLWKHVFLNAYAVEGLEAQDEIFRLYYEVQKRAEG